MGAGQSAAADAREQVLGQGGLQRWSVGEAGHGCAVYEDQKGKSVAFGGDTVDGPNLRESPVLEVPHPRLDERRIGEGLALGSLLALADQVVPSDGVRDD